MNDYRNGHHVNIRKASEVKPGEFASLIATVQAVADFQDKKPPPQPEKRRA